MVPRALQTWARAVAEGVAAPLARRGVMPNTITVLGFAFNVVTALVLATGHLSWGGGLLFLSGMFDMLDGALARITSRQSDFGAFLDSLLDRYSEAAILLALIYVFTVRHNTLIVLLVYAVAVGAILTSYARARAEGLGISSKVGIAPRPERIIILGLGLLINVPTTIAALVVLAVLTHFTTMQRLFDVWHQTHTRTGDQPRPATKPSETPAP